MNRAEAGGEGGGQVFHWSLARPRFLEVPFDWGTWVTAAASLASACRHSSMFYHSKNQIKKKQIKTRNNMLGSPPLRPKRATQYKNMDFYVVKLRGREKAAKGRRSIVPSRSSIGWMKSHWKRALELDQKMNNFFEVDLIDRKKEGLWPTGPPNFSFFCAASICGPQRGENGKKDDGL